MNKVTPYYSTTCIFIHFILYIYNVVFSCLFLCIVVYNICTLEFIGKGECFRKIGFNPTLFTYNERIFIHQNIHISFTNHTPMHDKGTFNIFRL